MRLLSRLRKSTEDGQQDDPALSPDGVDEEDEGLLMPTSPTSSADSADASSAQSALPRAIDADTDSGEDDPSLELDSSGEAAEAETPLIGAEDAPTETEEPAVEEAAATDDDDPLSAFTSDTVVSTELNALTDSVEDVSIADLVEQVREIRAMLPATPAEDEDVAA